MDSEDLESLTLDSASWCNKCSKFYYMCDEVAQQLNLVVLNGLYCEAIQLRCVKKSHLFEINYNKKLQNLGCYDCRKE